jgi:hypothetical protein
MLVNLPPPELPVLVQSQAAPAPALAPVPVPRAPPALPPAPTPVSLTLPPLDPIYLLRFDAMAPVWNALPAGTFWEFAQYALRVFLDFTHLNEAQLILSLVSRPASAPGPGPGENLQGVEEIRVWEDSAAALAEEDVQWAAEMDWEAQVIIEGLRRMLGVGVQADANANAGEGDGGAQFGTRYDGRVDFCATLTCAEGGDTHVQLDLDVNGRITLEKPAMRSSCLFTRAWGSHQFLRLKLSTVLLNRVRRNQSGRLLRELNAYCPRPIHILGREYHPLAEKENTVYYFLHGRDRIGLKAAEDAGKDPKKSYGVGRHIGTVEGLVQWWLAPEHNRHQLMSQLTTRLHLGLSDTLPGVFIKPENLKIIPDISTFVLLHTDQPSILRTHCRRRPAERNGYMFTDGAGLESGSVARACWRKNHPNDYSTPPATQIRIHSAKGVVQIDPNDVATGTFDGSYTLTLTESMAKVKYGP